MTLVLFDLDDTLLCGDSEEVWCEFMFENSLIKNKNFSTQMKAFNADYKAGKLDTLGYCNFLVHPLKGMTINEVESLSRSFAKEAINKLRDLTTDYLLSKHNTDRCVIVSATLSFLVEEISHLLNITTCFGTDAEIKDGYYSGKVLGRPNFSEEKVKRIKKWINSSSYSFREIYAYSDSIYDLPLLEFSDYPHALSPDDALRKVCIERNWKIIERE